MLLSEVSSRCTLGNESGGNVQIFALISSEAQDPDIHAGILPAREMGAVDRSFPPCPDPALAAEENEESVLYSA